MKFTLQQNTDRDTNTLAEAPAWAVTNVTSLCHERVKTYAEINQIMRDRWK